MNELCFPVGLNIKSQDIIHTIYIKNDFNYSVEKNILNKLYQLEKKTSSLKKKPLLKKKTRKHY
jgi:hypothetical protein